MTTPPSPSPPDTPSLPDLTSKGSATNETIAPPNLGEIPLCDNEDVVRSCILRAVQQFFAAPSDIHLAFDISFRSNDKRERSTAIAAIEISKPLGYKGVQVKPKSVLNKNDKPKDLPKPTPSVPVLAQEKKVPNEKHLARKLEIPSTEAYAVKTTNFNSFVGKSKREHVDENCVREEGLVLDPTGDDVSPPPTNSNTPSDSESSATHPSNNQPPPPIEHRVKRQILNEEPLEKIPVQEMKVEKKISEVKTAQEAVSPKKEAKEQCQKKVEQAVMTDPPEQAAKKRAEKEDKPVQTDQPKQKKLAFGDLELSDGPKRKTNVVLSVGWE